MFSAYDIWRQAAFDAGAAAYVDKTDLDTLGTVLNEVATGPFGRTLS